MKGNNPMQNKYALVLSTSINHDYVDESPEYAIIPTSSQILRKYQELLAKAKNTDIPDFSYFGLIDYSPTLVHHEFEEESEFTKRNLLPPELTSPDGPFIIPMPSEEELDQYAVRSELPFLQVYKHDVISFTGNLKHSDLTWFTTNAPHSALIAELIEFMENLEATAN